MTKIQKELKINDDCFHDKCNEKINKLELMNFGKTLK